MTTRPTLDDAWDELIARMRQDDPDPRQAALRWDSQPGLKAAADGVVAAFVHPPPAGRSALDQRRRELDALDAVDGIAGQVFHAQDRLDEELAPVWDAFDCSAHPELCPDWTPPED